MNNFTGIGRTTKDVILNKTQGGKSFVRFTLAINRTYNKEESDFISCVAWEQRAEFLNNYVPKGSLIAIQGEIRTGKYNGKDGKTVFTTDINVNQVNLLIKNEPKPQFDYGQTYQQEQEEPQESVYVNIDSDDLPF